MKQGVLLQNLILFIVNNVVFGVWSDNSQKNYFLKIFALLKKYLLLRVFYFVNKNKMDDERNKFINFNP
ncbi:MAG: hypothetical protein V1781_00890 [Bacteroidota bacterium]